MADGAYFGDTPVTAAACRHPALPVPAMQRDPVHAAFAAMAERVLKPRGRMAEPAHSYDFAEEDLA